MNTITKIALIATCFLSSIMGIYIFLTHHQWIDFSALEQYTHAHPTIILDDRGNEWARFQLERRDPVSFSSLPDHLVQAFLAAEDRNFFKHSGISVKGIIRSTLVNMYKRKIVQGASTITQQLVKLLFYSSQKTFKRKIQEQICALMIERHFTKEQILETYLNYVYFGNGIYGIQAASQCFWGKNVQELEVHESALLAAIVRSPNQYCPLIHQEQALQRRNIILRSMLACTYVTEESFHYFVHKPLGLIEQESSLGLYAREMVRQFLENLVGKDTLYTNGFIVQSTLNKEKQWHAEAIFKEHIQKLRDQTSTYVDGALISLSPKTGAIKAVVGGYNFSESQFNRVYAQRQLGSIIKPLLYAGALHAGINLNEIEIDEPFALSDNNSLWKPQNFDKKFEGPMTLAHALLISNNIVAIKTLLRLGPEKLSVLLQKTHVASEVPAYPSLALGCVESSLINITGMFNIFNNKGTYVKPYLIEWVKDRWGTKIWKHTEESESIFSWTIIDQINEVLKKVCTRIRERLSCASMPCESFGKTGTTNDARTVHFAGCTPSLTTLVYIGRDDNKPLGENIFSSTTAFPLWNAYNKAVLTSDTYVH